MVKEKYLKTDKKAGVQLMFNSIAPRYDFLNRFLSARMDVVWRKKTIKIIGKNNPKTILDVATGTGDLAITALRIHPEKIVGIDIAEEMLEAGRKKLQKRDADHIISLEKGDSENLRFKDGSFDATMVAFGVRNFENLEKGLTEMYRILKPGGQCLILEFSKPKVFPVKQLYSFYFRNIVPMLGRIISGDLSAYTYLPDSVGTFPDGQDFL
ncbi:MAG: bifunctional demethylmenaquinone methyltransferase/2-methoxy-6-polyprenyl-1,4-benzoquinol methylase UbiE, partial [Bacteroidales bacterium]|nr:bifunctional demethylmenaquinone methyltransferase/2-methoxy-6-polyprenyl-1,4-benzoquinol methylase UbiE [Bacteroidales bacterium]